MKSSTGMYFIGLDHVRAIATFLVFTWHFIHINNGHLALAPPAAFPVFLFSEGHTGVALFMTLSGYLFAKLLDGKKIIYSSFLWNRFLRLVPLLAVVIILSGIKRYLSGDNMAAYATLIVSGIVEPTLPNGGWSITVESHFYLSLPVLLLLSRRWEYFWFVYFLQPSPCECCWTCISGRFKSFPTTRLSDESTSLYLEF